VGNAVNSSMEEGLFRGVMITHLGSRMSLFKANLIQALLFAAWHLPITIRGYVDGQMSLGEAAFLSVGYVVTSGLAAFVWGYLYQKTNSLWGPWAAHALNNTTLNFAHITAAGGSSMVAVIVGVNALVIGALLPLVKRAAVRLNMPQIVTWV
jgi:membrane protease YdiL (CAAX protease family)